MSVLNTGNAPSVIAVRQMINEGCRDRKSALLIAELKSKSYGSERSGKLGRPSMNLRQLIAGSDRHLSAHLRHRWGLLSCRSDKSCSPVLPINFKVEIKLW
jgi:hypothetical protein